MRVLRSETMPLRLKDDIVLARQLVRARAMEAGFSLVDQTRLVTAASELARNTVDHGGGGTMTVELVGNDTGGTGLRLAFDDHGPGIPDIELALRDGYTTRGGLGLGLGGARRLSNEFEILKRTGSGYPGCRGAMAMNKTLALTIGDSSQVAEARRAAVALAMGLGFTETEAGRVAIVATEMVRNLVTHATEGRQFLLRALRCDESAGVEMMALDRGPGIANIAQSMRDGHSTAGTPGTGLGAVFRLSTATDIHSLRGTGTALLAQVWRSPGPPEAAPNAAAVGGVCIAKPGELYNGDSWAVREVGGRTLLLVADGLGHGEYAAEASDAAVAAFEAHPALSPASGVQAIHAALRNTRGAAVGVVELDSAKEVARYAGVGNIAGVILSDDGRKALVSHNGTAGGEVRRIDEFVYPWQRGAILIIHTDGLLTRRGLDDYPGLPLRHPSLIAGILCRDFARGTDDVTAVVAKMPAAG